MGLFDSLKNQALNALKTNGNKIGKEIGDNVKNAVKNASSKKAPKSAVQIAGDVVSTVLVYAMLIIMAFVVLVPIVWIVGASFNEQSSLLSATAFPEYLSSP